MVVLHDQLLTLPAALRRQRSQLTLFQRVTLVHIEREAVDGRCRSTMHML
jgi:hypothetical protein